MWRRKGRWQWTDGRTAAGVVAAAIAPVAIIAVLFPPALFLLSSTFNSFSLPRKCFYDKSVLNEQGGP